MTEYGFLTTEECANNCMICAQQGAGKLGVYAAGKTPEEVQGLENLMDAITPGLLMLTGGDPLRNLPFLEIVDKKAGVNYHGKTKATVVFNPLSFLTLSLGKSAKNITDEDIDVLEEELKENGFSDYMKRVLEIISKFENIAISDGNIQSPNTGIMKRARSIYEKFVQPKIDIFPDSFRTSAEFENDIFVNTFDTIVCVGKVLDLFKNGKVTPALMRNNVERYDKNFDCCGGYKQLYFKEEDHKVWLYLASCCKAGNTSYTSYRSNLSLEDMTGMEIDDLKSAFDEEVKKQENSVFYKLLNAPQKVLDHKGRGEIELTEIDRVSNEDRFAMYLEAAEDIVREKTDKEIDIVEGTRSFIGKPYACEVCHNVGIHLKKAGIKPSEWQEYLENKFT